MKEKSLFAATVPEIGSPYSEIFTRKDTNALFSLLFFKMSTNPPPKKTLTRPKVAGTKASMARARAISSQTSTTATASRPISTTNKRPTIAGTKASMARTKVNNSLTTAVTGKKRKLNEEPELPQTYEEAKASLNKRAAWDLRVTITQFFMRTN